jgi:hypothetical protein
MELDMLLTRLAFIKRVKSKNNVKSGGEATPKIK